MRHNLLGVDHSNQRNLEEQGSRGLAGISLGKMPLAQKREYSLKIKEYGMFLGIVLLLND